VRKPSVIVRVPASTANLGPGFDTLGVALKLHNHITLRELDAPAIELVSGGKNLPPSNAAHAMAREVVEKFYERAKLRPQGAHIEIKGDVPISRGLGSSVTVRLGILFALNELNNRPLSNAAMLELVTALEGHPDNCVPALFGGFCVSAIIGGAVRHRRFAVPQGLKFVAVVPDFDVPTEKARAILPKQVPLADAVENVSRAALIAATFASGDFSLLKNLFDDKLHQPYRKKLNPQLDDAISAGVHAGALGGWLSGSGSTVICLTESKEKAVAEAMAAAFAREKIACETHILVADNDGTRVKRG
jgi:homoserine kinase